MLELFARMYAETDDPAPVAQRLQALLERVVASAELRAVRPYWKIEGYQEIYFRLRAFGAAEDVLERLRAALGTGWLLVHDGCLIWNPGAEASFVEPSVRWAHLEALTDD